MHHLIREFHRTPWAILPETLASMQTVLTRWSSGVRLNDAEISAAIGDSSRQQPRSPGNVAVIPVFGIISQRAGMVSDLSTGAGTSTESIGKQLRAAVDDSSISAIVLNVDSPGGSVHGVAEVADQIYAARAAKPVIASVNSLAASAAYWIASAAQEVVITPSGEAGSIGVYAAHQDQSAALESDGVRVTLISAGRYKVEGNPFEPLGDEARAAIQSSVDAHYSAFVGGVARYRGVRPDAVRNGYGEGRVLGAQQAVDAGLADRIGTFDEVISGLRRTGTANARRRLALAAY